MPQNLINWKSTLVTDNGVVPPGKKPLPEPILTEIYDACGITRPQRIRENLKFRIMLISTKCIYEMDPVHIIRLAHTIFITTFSKAYITVSKEGDPCSLCFILWVYHQSPRLISTNGQGLFSTRNRLGVIPFDSYLWSQPLNPVSRDQR